MKKLADKKSLFRSCVSQWT